MTKTASVHLNLVVRILKSERVGLNRGSVLADVLGDLGHVLEAVQLRGILERVQVVVDPVRSFAGESLEEAEDNL